MKKNQILALGLVSAFGATQAAAAIVSYPDRVDFNTAVDADTSLTKSIENWDSYAEGTTVANGASLNGITYNSSTEIAIVTSSFLPLSSPNTLGRTTTDFFEGTDTMTFSFANPIYAFGISFNTFATGTGDYQVQSSAGNADSAFDPFPGASSGEFAGFISDTAFSSVTVTGLGTANSYTLDDLTYATKGTSVPDTGTTFGLFAAAFVGLAVLRQPRSLAAAFASN